MRDRRHALLRHAALIMGFALALCQLGCGGMSVRHEETDAGAENRGSGGTNPNPDKNEADGAGERTDIGSACVSVCGDCLGQAADCNGVCSTLVADVAKSGCDSALKRLLACQKQARSGCDTRDCATENNAFAACVINYCDDHPAAPSCITPL